MQTKSRIVSLLLAVIMVLSLLPMDSIASFAISAADFTEPTIFVDSKYSAANSTVSVDVIIANNPGIAGATLTVAYDQYLTLTSAENGSAFSNLSFTKPGSFANPSRFLWDSESGEAKGDGTILTLTFEVSASAPEDANLSIELSSNAGDFYDEDMETVNLQFVNGTITVIDYLPGDVNDDGIINGKDVTLVRRHIVGGYDQTIDIRAANVNGDYTINGKDVTAIRRYIVCGYGVELIPSPLVCDHQLELVKEYQAATCTEPGNIAYWHCTVCDNYFKDAAGSTEVSLENTIIAAKGHTVVIDPPTDEYTEGSHCSECGEVLVAPQPVDNPNRQIIYHLFDDDEYIAEVGVNNPNPDHYTASGLTLEKASVNGYKFEGWYDSGDDKVTKIAAGETGTVILYAHWSRIPYTVTFNSPLVAVESKTYYVDTGLSLTEPFLGGYNFMGWSKTETYYLTTDDGEILTNDDGGIRREKEVIVSSIPRGTTGNITLNANWSSKRNMTKPVSELNNPFIVEDSDNGVITFSYEIGTIENVPLYQIGETFQSVNGLIQTFSETKTDSISNTKATEIANTVSKATSSSTSWTLSNDWNSTTSVDETEATSRGKTVEEAESLSKTQTGTYSLNSSVGGSSSVVNNSGYSATLGADRSGSITNSQETGQNFKLSVDAKYSRTNEISAGASFPVKVVDVNVGAKRSSTFEIGAGADYSNYVKNKTSGTNSWSDSMELNQYASKTATNEKNWNTTTGYSLSNSTSQNRSISTALSEVISKELHYGSSYSKGGSQSDSQSFENSESNSNQYSDAITYSDAQTTTTTKSVTMNGEREGFYRVVCAGKLHVFGVVVYEVATSTYSVCTYSVMDDETTSFIDYSRSTTSFNDYENGVLPFEVPSFVNDYVNSKIANSDGLQVNLSTGMITNYSGSDEVVIIPSYISVENQDGTYSSVKVTGIEEDVFQDNDTIVAVHLSDYITSIPDNAFSGCSSLLEVVCPGVTAIGNNAFSGCTSLNKFEVSESVTSIGNNAFDDVPEVFITAAYNSIDNSTTAPEATACGADKVTVDISGVVDRINGTELIVSDATNYFELQGKQNVFENLKIQSDAATTVLNGLTISNNSKIPFVSSSTNVVFNRTNINASGFAWIQTNDVNVGLFGTNSLSSDNNKAVVSRKINLTNINESVQAELIISGDLYVCDKEEYITDNGYLRFTSGQIRPITENEFEQYIRGIFVIGFNANGGTVSTTEKVAFYGIPVGELPTPTRMYYTFDGWYTGETGGELITADSVITDNSDITLYAHWTQNPISDWVLESDVPSNATVINTKYKYKLRTYTTSTSSPLSGWTKYDEKTTTSYGNWSGWSEWMPGSASSTDVQNVENATVYGYYYYLCPNCGTHNHVYTKCFNYNGGCGSTSMTYGDFYSTFSTTPWSSCYEWHGTGKYAIDSLPGGRWWRWDGRANGEPGYRIRTRSKTVTTTYYYYKDTDEESYSDPTGQTNVSNVVKWVQYREK